MSAKACFPIAVLLTFVGLWGARGQDAPVPTAGATEAGAPQEALPAPKEAAATPSAPESGQAAPVTPSITSPMSSWIIHNQTDCCGPIGGSGPINTELYFTTGPTLPVAGGFLHHALDTGWVVGGGGRSMFFNPAVDAAWTADLSLLYFYNHGRPNQKILVTADISNPPVGLPAGPGVTVQGHVKDLNRTFVTAALGREWYLNAPANAAGWKWRAGFDIGGRIGSGLADFALEPNQGFIGQGQEGLGHKTDTIYGLELALHTDLEIPWGCCTFTYGFRAEWDYTWMDILQPRNAHLAQPLNSQLQDVNLLLTFGVRF